MELRLFKDKQGNKLTAQEFISRWKSGIEGVTPQQKIKVQMQSVVIMLIGILLGFVVSLFNIKNFWWGSIILAGAFGNTFIQFISLLQQKKIFDNINKLMYQSEYINKQSEGGTNEF